MVLSLVYPIIVYSLFDLCIKYATIESGGLSIFAINQARKEVMWLLTLTQIAFLTLTFLISLFVSHRVAGPVQKLRLCIAELRNGNLNVKVSFRKQDHFPAIADDLNEFIQELNYHAEHRNKILTQSIENIEKAMDYTSDSGKPHLHSASELLKSLETPRAT